MEIIPFKSEHLLTLDVQDAQQSSRAFFEPRHLALIEQNASFTALIGGLPVACFGWVELHPTRALLWSVLARHAGEHMTALTRAGKRLVDSLPHRRIEAEVDAEFFAGQRWMEMLGLCCETATPLRAYTAAGGDAYIYAKVN